MINATDKLAVWKVANAFRRNAGRTALVFADFQAFLTTFENAAVDFDAFVSDLVAERVINGRGTETIDATKDR